MTLRWNLPDPRDFHHLTGYRLYANGVFAGTSPVSDSWGTFTLAGGQMYSLVIASVDDHGGESRSLPVSVLVPIATPTITLTHPTPGQTVTSDKVTFTGTVSAGVRAVGVNGQTFPVTGTSFALDVAGLPAGANDLLVYAFTYSGEPATANAAFTFNPGTRQSG